MQPVLCLISLLLLSAKTLAVEYRCQPRVKHYCSEAGCQRDTEGFQHAEVFLYHSEGPALGACLWTVCYSGTAMRFTSADGEQTTVIGQLAPEHSPEMYAPMLISLTLDKQLRFTAIWQYQGSAVTLDHGECEVLPPATPS